MTRKHFEAIAATLNANVAPLNLVLDFADMLEEENDRFDRGRFVVAATLELSERLNYDRKVLTRESI